MFIPWCESILQVLGSFSNLELETGSQGNKTTIFDPSKNILLKCDMNNWSGIGLKVLLKPKQFDSLHDWKVLTTSKQNSKLRRVYNINWNSSHTSNFESNEVYNVHYQAICYSIHHGFRKNKSVGTAATQLLEPVIDSTDRGHKW